MELTMTNSFGFCELNEQEMMEVDGGAITTEPCKFIVSSVVGLAVGKGIEKVGAKIVRCSISDGHSIRNIIFQIIVSLISCPRTCSKSRFSVTFPRRLSLRNKPLSYQ